ncbi:MAG: low molecular weight protein arginine phosphatase [Oscillospiraceae bacterium]|jgi:protein-tyrosine-phosphatase|nr:low molecular weight protein arginine phosphatase [Oscillospiraceae bacterium]
MRVLFVCTGNTCRSPLAEVLAKAARPEWETRSRGLAADDGAGASAYAAEAAKERGCGLIRHAARQLSEEDLLWSDVVYGMTAAHVSVLRNAYPAHAGKIRTLPGGDVPDPFGGELSDYRACAARLAEDIETL